MTLEQYLDRVAENRNCCEICRQPCDSLHVDHNHLTGDIRGLLCGHCNKGIGHLKEDTSILKNAIKYLEDYAPSFRQE